MGEIRRIQLTGLTTTPSDYDCKDGDLSLAINAMDEGGGMTALSSPKVVVSRDTLDEGEVVFVHKTSSFAHYIVKRGNNLLWLDKGSDELHAISINVLVQNLAMINAIGNILLTNINGSMRYLQWKSGEYIDLGSEIPMPEFEFKLKGGAVVETAEFAVISKDYAKGKLVEGDRVRFTGGEYENYAYDTERGSNWTIEAESNFKFDSSVFRIIVPKNTEVCRLQIQHNGKYESDWLLCVSNMQGTYPEIKDADVWYVRFDDNGIKNTATEISIIREEINGDTNYREIEVRVKSGYAICFVNTYATPINKEIIKIPESDANTIRLYCAYDGWNTYNPASDGKLRIVNMYAAASGANYVIKDEEGLYEKYDAFAKKNISKYSSSSNKFLYPFFVRYGLRMYDGEIFAMSSPCYMVPCEGQIPAVFAKMDGEEVEEKTYFAFNPCELQWKLKAGSAENISAWKDILDSVDLFVSAPLYTYNQGYKKNDDIDFATIADYNNTSREYLGAYSIGAKMSAINDVVVDAFGSADNLIEIKQDNEGMDSIQKRIANNTIPFYKIASVQINEIGSTITAEDFNTVEIPRGTLGDSLYTRENESSYSTYLNDTRKINADKSFVFNRRLHLFNTSDEILQNTGLFCENGIVERYKKGAPVVFRNRPGEFYTIAEFGFLIVYNYDDGEKYYASTSAEYYSPMNWIYAADNKADSVVIYVKCAGRALAKPRYKVTKYNLSKNSNLNGKYMYTTLENFSFEAGWKSEEDLTDDEKAYISKIKGGVSAGDKRVPTNNKLYVSLPENPWVIPAGNTNAIGNEKILGVKSSVKALSEGQFGEYPLYVFTSDEGVYALTPDDTGVYKAIQPVSREIATSSEGIVSLDDSVAFVTTRGIKVIQGSQVQDISQALDMNVVPMGEMKYLKQLLEDSMPEGTDVESLLFGDYSKNEYYEFIQGAKLCYDYKNERLYVYNNAEEGNARKYPFSLVYSLKTRTWACDTYPVDSVLNTYPECYAMKDGDMVEVGAYTGGIVKKGPIPTPIMIPWFVLTRPIKWGETDIYKTVETLTIRGTYALLDKAEKTTTAVPQIVLYGSNDMEHWAVVSSSKKNYIRNHSGTPYKYFRLLAFGKMMPKMHTISFVEAEVTDRMTNKMR